MFLEHNQTQRKAMDKIYECYHCEHRFYFSQVEGLIDGAYPRCPKCGSYAEPLTDPDDDDEISEESEDTDNDEDAVETECETDLNL